MKGRIDPAKDHLLADAQESVAQLKEEGWTIPEVVSVVCHRLRIEVPEEYQLAEMV